MRRRERGGLDEIMYGATVRRWCACRGARMRWRSTVAERRATDGAAGVRRDRREREEEEEEDGERERKKSRNECPSEEQRE